MKKWLILGGLAVVTLACGILDPLWLKCWPQENILADILTAMSKTFLIDFSC